MPVDYEAQIAEIAGDDVELATILREKLSKNQNAATRLANGFLGKADVTRKQQEVADEKRRLTATQSAYEQQLNEANSKIDKIMGDLANERISRSTAEQRLLTVKEKYALDDSDIPSSSVITRTERTGTAPNTEIDIDAKLKTLREDLMKEVSKTLIPELTALTKLGPAWSDIVYEHEQLTGKRLTSKEQNELLEKARMANNGNGTSIKNIWEQEYSIPDIRLNKIKQDERAAAIQEYKDEQMRLASEAAISGMKNRGNEQVRQDDLSSPIFKRKFDVADTQDQAGNQPPNSRMVIPPAQDPLDGLKGADRAAARYIQRRQAGVPMGQPEKVA